MTGRAYHRGAEKRAVVCEWGKWNGSAQAVTSGFRKPFLAALGRVTVFQEAGRLPAPQRTS